MRPPALFCSGLEVRLARGDAIVEGVGLRIASGEILGLVGESGAGKTTTALAILGYATFSARLTFVDMHVAGESLPTLDGLRSARGRLISYVPQDPGAALNPSLRIVHTIEDRLRAFPESGGLDAVRRAEELMEIVGLPATRDFCRRYPHQLSGGEQQRVCIAAALATRPALLVLDEPTTGLDVIARAHILDLLAQLRKHEQVSMLYVSHDLAAVSGLADRIAVMYAGRIVEQAPTPDLLRHPRHSYTRTLLDATPDPASRPLALDAAAPGYRVRRSDRRSEQSLDAAPPVVRALSDEPSLRVLEVRQLHAEHRRGRRTIVAADEVSFAIARSSCVALVGRSGSGKTTIARCIAGLHPPTVGEILLDGLPLGRIARARTREQRRRIQMVAQSPADALNPRHTVRHAIGRSLRLLRRLGRHHVGAEIERLLDDVRLPSRVIDRYPSELSGGERQRVAVARALAAEPELIICDEVTSSLDVSVQASVLDVLEDSRSRLGLALLLITHDLGVAAAIADRTVVIDHGILCEQGSTEQVLHSPADLRTRALVAASPSLGEAHDRWAAQHS